MSKLKKIVEIHSLRTVVIHDPLHDNTTVIELGGLSVKNLTSAEIKVFYESNPDTNEFSDALLTKLDGIAPGAGANQTGAEIKTLYEAEADTNAFDDAAVAKLAGIEASATADQTGAEIKTAYEGELDTNAFDDAAVTKLAGVESAATADQTDAEIAAAYGGEVPQVSAPEITAGTEVAIRRSSPADIKAMIDTHATPVLAYDLGLDFLAVPAASEVVGRWHVPRQVSLAADFAGSGGLIDTNPTATLNLDVQDDGVSIGTVSISTAGVFTFTTVGATKKAVAAGSVVQVIAPVGVDATAAGILITFNGSSGFTPLQLFSGGVLGAIYDPSVLSSVWQDSARTVPGAVDSPVGALDDLSGNGNHATQTTAAKRPILRSSGGVSWIEGDGVDDWLLVPAGVFAISTDLVLGVSQSLDGGDAWPNVFGQTPSNEGMTLVYKNLARLPRPLIKTDLDLLQTNALGAVGFGEDHTFIQEWDRSAFTLTLDQDGTQVVTATGTGVADLVPPTHYSLLGNGVGAENMGGKINACVLLSDSLTLDGKTDLKAWLDGKAGL